MANLKTDSPLSRRIVRTFLDFLRSLEPAEGVDLESLEVARECLSEVFKLDSHSSDVGVVDPGALVNVFRSFDANGQQTDRTHRTNSTTAPITCDSASKSQVESSMQEPYADGQSKDELCGQFFAALEKTHFFKTRSDGSDDPVQLDKATSLFHDSVNEMNKAGCHLYNRQSLAEALKSQGNRAMQSKDYSNAIELYTCAIALSENKAVYYCNRAAAYTQVQKCNEAIGDCLKAIEIDPNYSKAYSRLGLAYYARGNYRDAIDKGFKKALQLDPNNESVKENIRVAEQKLREGQQRTGWDQNTNSSNYTSHEFNNSQTPGGSWNHGTAPPPFSISFDSSIPGGFANVFRNIVSQAQTGGRTTDSQRRDGDVGCQEFNSDASGGSRNQGPAPPPPFSMPSGSNINPGEFASMFMNMASQGQAASMEAQSPEGQGRDESGGGGPNEPEIRIDGNINLDLGDNMPEELRGALRSVMEMLSGGSSTAAPQGNDPHNSTGRPTSN